MATLDEKLNEWKCQLLDLSKRNRLLNFRVTKRQTLRIQQPEIEVVFKRLVGAEKPLTIIGVDSKLLPNSVDDSADLAHSATVPSIKANEIQFSGSPQAIATALYTLRSRSKTEYEERGVGVLFIAFGFLRWFESDDSNCECVSPVVLVPVDLERKTALEPYQLVTRDEDVVVNPTLQKALEDQFKIKLPDIPNDDTWSIAEYLEQIHNEIDRQSRWRIDKDAYLSVFSFLKLNMYKDLEDGEAIAEQSPLLQAFAGDLSMLTAAIDGFQEIPACELDERVDPAQCMQVLDADSSQQQAIEFAKAGGSFVLQGPPGTGKSQTIANIIAELLGLGKTVLFVSEKAAALDVVYRRLADVGLADSCLALHSHKANKRDVVKELGRLFQTTKGSVATSSFPYSRLREQRNELNLYVRELHVKRDPMGKSIFEVESQVATLHEIPLVQFQVSGIDKLTQDQLERMHDPVLRLASNAQRIKEIECMSWRGAEISDRSQEVVQETLNEAANNCNEVARRSRALADRLGLNSTELTFDRSEWLIGIARAIVDGPDFNGLWLTNERFRKLTVSAAEAKTQHLAALNETGEISDVFTENFFAYGLDALSNRLKTEYNSFIGRYIRCRRELRELSVLTTSGKKPKFADLKRLVPIAIQLRRRRDWINTSVDRLAEEFGPWYCGDSTDWDALERALAWTEKLSGLFGGSAPDSFADRIATLLTDREGLRSEADSVEKFRCSAIALLDEVESWFADSSPMRTILKEKLSRPLSFLAEHCTALVGSIEGLSAWSHLARAVDACKKSGIGDPTDIVFSSQLTPENCINALEKRVLTLWLGHWLEVVPILRDFEVISHAHRIETFRQLDSGLKNDARRILVARLANRRPHPSSASINLGSSQPSLLMKEIKKKRRHKPLRVLFSEIPELLVAIKPCLMMSPLSISQFLSVGTVRLDVVVFDEASQIKPEDAVGAIMRGSQVIVVGDSKQLPPTSFFDVSMSDDDVDEDKYYDSDKNAFESILDLCGTVGLPERMLEWHYRSRREGLIAFSNNFLYDNHLVTFPSSDFNGTGTGIEFVHVSGGVYDRGRTRTNAHEVQKVRDIVLEHARKHPNKSLGVVAFSQAQMAAIDIAIWSMRSEDPTLEAFFGNTHDEPFFVKNLENVQGDERDIIVFSVGYGRESTGKLAMNFGPLNNRGGERRLNVAVTRAREQVFLVSSIRGADIDLSRTNAEGVRLLKHYLDYAEYGRNALKDLRVFDKNAEFESQFEEQVATVLETNGYCVHKQVGCSGYRIDLAVVYPDRPGQYALGIECDGASYHSAATARERDRLREQVLKELGWRLYRIWSTDWYRSRTQQVQKLLTAVKEAIEAPMPSTAIKLQIEPARKESVVAMAMLEPEPVIDDIPSNKHSYEGTVPYVEYKPGRQTSNFYESMLEVKKVLLNVVDAEAPLHEDIAMRRIASAWEIARVGRRVQDMYKRALELCRKEKAVVIRGGFVYSTNEKPLIVRRNDREGPARQAKHIPPEEIAAAAEIVLKAQIKLSFDDLIVATARVLGFDRTGTEVHFFIEAGIQLLIKSGTAAYYAGNISIVT